MNKLVYTCFKTIMVAMILVFVFDMTSYLYRVLSLNQRMESIMTSMQKVVMENNYLPESSYQMYKSLLIQLTNDMNGESGTTLVKKNADKQWFIDGIDLNYDTVAHDALTEIKADRATSTGTVNSYNVLVDKMSLPASYGDVMIVQATVRVEAPSWDFKADKRGSQNFQNSYTDSSIQQRTVDLVYTYYVPCLNYKAKS